MARLGAVPFALRFAFTAAFLVGAMVATPAGAAQPVPTRACTSGDLSAVYWLVDFKETPSGVFTNGAGTVPFQFLAFFPNATWSQAAFNMRPESTEFIMRSLRAQLPGTTYTLQPDGTVTLLRGTMVMFNGSCAVSLADGQGFQKDDVILAGNQRGSESSIHRLFRRWTGGPAVAAVSTFDPAPAPGPPAEATQASPDLAPTLADEPAPVQAGISWLPNGNGSRDAWIFAANVSRTPLSAFAVEVRGRQTNGQWKVFYQDACLAHRQAWQPGEQWNTRAGIPLQVLPIEAKAGAALFSDGSTWGKPHLLGKLKAHRGSCKWPGS